MVRVWECSLQSCQSLAVIPDCQAHRDCIHGMMPEEDRIFLAELLNLAEVGAESSVALCEN